MKLNLRKVMALGVAALIGLGASAQTLTQEWAHTTGVQADASTRFCTGWEESVIIPDKSGHSLIKWTKDGQSVLKDLTEIFENTEELYTMSTVIEKVDTIAAEGQDTIFDTTWTEVKKLDGLGTAITTDDAGNIIVNTNFPNTPSSVEWIIVPADGSDPVFLPITLPDDIAAGRLDQIGRTVGNVMSEEGGYMYLPINGASAIAVVKVVSGAQDDAIASPALSVVTMNTSVLVQPTCATVEDVEAAVDPSTTFLLRKRSDGFYSWNEDGTELAKMTTITENSGGEEGFDIFTLGDTQYMVQAAKSSLAKRSLSLAVYNVATGEVVASFNNDTEQNQWGSFCARPIDDENVAIYQFCAGKQVALYTFTVATEEPVAPLYMVGHNNVWDPANPTEIPATETAGVYSLSGVEFTNPEKAFKISENKGTWDEFDAKAMCADGDAVVQINTPTKLWLYAGTNITYAENGTYDVTVDLSGEVKTITLKKSSGVEDIEAVETVAPVYYNLQGVEVANPANGLYIVKRGNKVAKEVVVK